MRNGGFVEILLDLLEKGGVEGEVVILTRVQSSNSCKDFLFFIC